jgi:ABC-type glycerol-3-phosphate transport system permease component
VLDGAGTWRQFWSIALPLVRPALATVMVLDLLTHWGDFLWPLMISTREETRTVQLSLANLFTQPPIRWGDILACAVMATLPVMAIFHWLQEGAEDAESIAREFGTVDGPSSSLTSMRVKFGIQELTNGAE